MRAMVFYGNGPKLGLRDMPIPAPGADQVLIRIEACGVCRTDLHIVDSDLKNPVLPLIPGHEIVGRIERMGNAVSNLRRGQRVGVPWLGHTCGSCDYCRSARENLCDAPGFTGYTINGGYAEYCAADAHFVFPLPEQAELKGVRKGGRVICGGIHMSDIPGFPYADLWQERSILSVANLTRADGEAFFSAGCGSRR